VIVRGPEATLESSDFVEADDGRIIVYADVSSIAELKTPGRHENVKVPLRGPEKAANLSFPRDSRVTATLVVREDNRTYTVERMPIWLMQPTDPEDPDRVIIEQPPNGVLFNVPVIGPPDKIALLEDPDYSPRPVAFLRITEQQTNVPFTRELEFDLPEGVTVAPSFTQREATYHLAEREPAP
jgi:hypothetical protein